MDLTYETFRRRDSLLITLAQYFGIDTNPYILSQSDTLGRLFFILNLTSLQIR